MHSHNNRLKTFVLFMVLVVILLAIGWLIALATGRMIWIGVFGAMSLISIAISYWNSDKIALKSMHAYSVSPQDQPEMYRIVEELSQRAQQPMPRLYVSPTSSPNAFATGRNPQNAAVCCTEGILHMLNARELRGVLGHELMHVYNRDILTSSIAAAMASLITSVSHMLLFVGAGRGGRDNGGNPLAIIGLILTMILAPLAASLVQLAISRSREYDADQDGASLTEDPLALASALYKLQHGVQAAPLPQEDNKLVSSAHMMIANPFGGQSAKAWFSTHPPMEDRVQRLEGMARSLGQLD
ncbi:zinc metalloprotease HtpX [Auritidibacter ignavus]|uniref:zinc metalloprotease HtpX n=1 Tax=Auritidibacter ignavus TaxID=678932 RepID=UPI000F01E0D8|nr:zinc metalloprotease HtpX [Auritidibacter ignavus]NIH71368.1 heat shock protein HtpX [Auritidibacter ignavus]RMX22481.1 zinc metalloprotease HtpX [Auritidibacter ignavus]WGH83750.1 zinc metalloprotease HtpX [Auritidibacter ignavus]WHS28578.1 zinc metalloprotease HtpX [Auritidibacter ignavus]WHS35474.1 zinc metalloprotease HtpX [Auritidibacter ignavus]